MAENSPLKLKLQILAISDDWTIANNQFYDLHPEGNVSDDNNFMYFDEDMLLIEKGDYHIDLGWYGGELGRYCIYLFRGNFLEGELLERFQSTKKDEIVERINQLIHAVDTHQFDKLSGHLVSEENSREFANFEQYQILK